MSTAEDKFVVAAVQDAPVFLDRDATIEKACDLIARAGKDGARLVVFPESFVSGYPDWVWVVPGSRKAVIDQMYRELIRSAVSVPDAATEKLCRAAKQSGVYVAIGVSERNAEASNASLYNSILYVDDRGSIMGKHRKLVPTGGERLMWGQGDGSTLPVFDTSVGRMGGLICWENFMPLARYGQYARGVQLHVAPTWDSSDAWVLAMRNAAREGGMYVISCCQALRMSDIPDRYDWKSLYPEGREWVNRGNSCVIDPKGGIVAGPLAESQDILFADVDLGMIPGAKWIFDAAGHYARPDVFRYAINVGENPMVEFTDSDEN
jgi:nitrilase